MRLDPSQLLAEAAAAVRRGALGEAAEIAVAVVDIELAGAPDVLRLQTAQRMVRQIGGLNATLAAAESGGVAQRGLQLVLPWRA